MTSQQSFHESNFEAALTHTFLKLDEKLRIKSDAKDNFADQEGSTACVVLLTKEKIYCANAGDSRAIIRINRRPVPLSYDHKPDDEKEEERIIKAKHDVENGRVDAELNVSRGFGDFQFKDAPELPDE